jgi:hypothetical protein
MTSSDRAGDASATGCPKRPRSDAELGFVRRPMVRWFDPHQLVDTVARVITSGVWSSYADSRELQAQVGAKVHDRSDGQELWIDYVSDLGDGWNSTYTVARLLAREELALSTDGDNGDEERTRRGAILVMGGDQVYPVPKRTQYENRLIGPYRSALPCTQAAGPSGPVRAGDTGPTLFAIPGSHDWYDGLINFRNLFCQGLRIGAWRTAQTRSYFAIKLPKRWWLWGVDLQFGDYLDEAQVSYFAEAAGDMEAGDRIILCESKEVESGRKSSEVFSERNLARLEREVVEAAGARVALYLKSGRHYYSRYEQEGGGAQLITAGGGGAFMHPTHDLAERSHPHGRDGDAGYVRATVYPSPAASKRLRKWLFVLPGYNLPLAAVFGAVYVLVAFMLNLHLDEGHRSLAVGDLRGALWRSPTAFLIIVLVILTFAALVRLAHEASGAARMLVGLVHTALLFATLAAVMLLASELSSGIESNPASLVAFLALVAVLGGVFGVLGMSAYLWATNVLGFHGNEAYAPLHYENYKNFLRMHIDADGGLTVYPVGIDKVGKKWRLCPDAADDAPWFEPDGAEPAPHLIEAPIRIEGRA